MLVDPVRRHKLGRQVRSEWTPGTSGPYTLLVPASRSDARILLLATGAVVLAGLLVAAVLLLATSRGSAPAKYQPFAAGDASSIQRQLKDGGPYFYPDPFGGDRNILLALEHGQIVALSTILPNTTDCQVKWKGSVNHFVDCHGDRLDSTALERYHVEVSESGSTKGLLLIDLRTKTPAPQPA
jgi:hypothetical protein